jgi:hypothetical protein
MPNKDKGLLDNACSPYYFSMPSICQVPECERVVKAFGYCRLHWDRLKKMVMLIKSSMFGK